MKKILTFILITTTLYCKGQGRDIQTIDSKIIRTWGSSIECKFVRVIEDGDTSEYFAMVYDNLRYRTISDMISIIKINQSELDVFIADAESVQKWISENKGIDASYTINEFTLSNYSGPGASKGFIMISSQDPRDRDGYTFLTYKTLPEFIDYIKSRKLIN